MAVGGTYTLLVHLGADVSIDVGALGTYSFESGWYAYVGSALGPGGFSRIDRHRELAAGERDVRHWHIDYLLGHPETTLESTVRTAECDGECAIAQQLTEMCERSAIVDGTPITQFGCTDCSCDSHLFFASDGESLHESVEAAHQRLR